MSTSTDIQINQKQGVIKKCPSCGGELKAFSSSCDLCGHELADVMANKTVSYLAEKFEEIGIEVSNQGLKGSSLEKEISMRKARVIRDFPIPNSREDLQSLIYFIHPKIQYNAKPDPNAEDWRVKFKEVMTLARNAYKGDAKVRSEFDEIERSLKTSAIDPIKRNPVVAIILGMVVVLAAAGVGVSQYNEWKTEQCQKKLASDIVAEKSRLNNVVAAVSAKISEMKFEEAKTALNSLQWSLVDPCRADGSSLEKTQWEEKRQALLVSIQNGEAVAVAQKKSQDLAAEKTEQDKKRDEIARKLSEQRVIAERNLTKQREQIDRDMEDSLSSRARAAATRR